MVPGAGVEPAWGLNSPPGPQPGASACSAIPALEMPHAAVAARRRKAGPPEHHSTQASPLGRRTADRSREPQKLSARAPGLPSPAEAGRASPAAHGRRPRSAGPRHRRNGEPQPDSSIIIPEPPRRSSPFQNAPASPPSPEPTGRSSPFQNAPPSPLPPNRPAGQARFRATLPVGLRDGRGGTSFQVTVTRGAQRGRETRSRRTPTTGRRVRLTPAHRTGAAAGGPSPSARVGRSSTTRTLSRSTPLPFRLRPRVRARGARA